MSKNLGMDLLKVTARVAAPKFDVSRLRSMDDPDEVRELVQSSLEKLGEGDGREVYLLDSKRVLKLSKNEGGSAQNASETRISRNPKAQSILPKVFETGPDMLWIVSEIVRPLSSEEEFEELVGESLESFVQDPQFLGNDYEKTMDRRAESFVIVLTDAGPNKEKVAETLDSLRSFGLFELKQDGRFDAEQFFQDLPMTVEAEASEDEALRLQKGLQTAGATVEVSKIGPDPNRARKDALKAALRDDLLEGDLYDYAHWGKTADGRVVLLDAGLDDAASVHYRRR